MHLHLLNAPGVLGARGAADKSNGVNELSVIPEDVVVRITDGGNQSMS